MSAIEFLKNLEVQLVMQDNACTRMPIYAVQEKVMVTGIDTAYTDEVVWLWDGDVVGEDDGDEWTHSKLEALHAEGLDTPEDACRTGVAWRNEVREVFLTKRAAEDYIRSHAHRHSGHLSLYVDSAYRNPELREIRRLLSGPVRECIASLKSFVELANKQVHPAEENAHLMAMIRATSRGIAAIESLETAKDPHS